MKIKRFLLMLIVMLMGVTGVWAQDDSNNLKWEYNRDTHTLTFSSVDPSSEPVAIPDYEDCMKPWFWDIIEAESIKLINISRIGNHALEDAMYITSIDIPNTVTSIGEDAFFNCTSLTSVILPNSITSIGSSAFMDCTSLTSINIPNQVTNLHATFYGCTSLTSITIPASVSNLDNYVFAYCTGLTSIKVERETPPSVSPLCFSEETKSIPVYVPIGKGEAYRAAEVWSEFSNIIDYHLYDESAEPGTPAYYTCSVCGEIDPVRQHVHSYEWVNIDQHQHKQVCTSDVGTCTERETNQSEHCTPDLHNDESYYHCICGYVDEEKKAQIEARDYFSLNAVDGDVTLGMQKIGAPDNCLLQVSTDGNTWSEPMILSESTDNIVTIPSGETRYFRRGSFTAADRISSGYYEDYWSFTMDGTGTIEANGNMMSLLDMTCQKNTLGDEDNAFTKLFEGCEQLKSVTINSQVLLNNGNVNYVFGKGVSTYIIGNGVTTIGKGAFSSNAAITSVTIPEGVISINDQAFAQCSGLTSLIIPSTVQSIGNQAFIRSKNMDIELHSVPTVGSGTFNGVDGGKHLILDDNSYVYTGSNTYFPQLASASYTRSMANEWGTVVVPFNVAPSTNDYTLYAISSVTNDQLELTKCEEDVPAGTPVLVRMKAPAMTSFGKYELNLTAENVSADAAGTLTGATVDGLTLTGTYYVNDITSENGYIISNNKFWSIQDVKGTNSVYNAPFRAYIASDGPARAKQMSLSVDNYGVTSVDALNAITSGKAECYDLSGNRIPQLRQGINIVKLPSGKTQKVLVK